MASARRPQELEFQEIVSPTQLYITIGNPIAVIRNTIEPQDLKSLDSKVVNWDELGGHHTATIAEGVLSPGVYTGSKQDVREMYKQLAERLNDILAVALVDRDGKRYFEIPGQIIGTGETPGGLEMGLKIRILDEERRALIRDFFKKFGESFGRFGHNYVMWPPTKSADDSPDNDVIPRKHSRAVTLFRLY